MNLPKHSSLAYWAAGLTLLVWSSAYAAISYGLKLFTPGEIALVRFAVAASVFAVPVALGRVKLPPRQDWPAVILLALVGHTLYQLALGYSMTRLSAGAAAVVISTVPSVTAVLAMLRLQEHISPRAASGLAIAFAGTLLVTLGRGHGIHFEPLAFLVFVAVMASAVNFVFQKPLLARTDALGFTAASMFVATLSFLPLGAALPAKLAAAPWPQLASLLYLGLFPTVIGFVCWSFALARAPASRVASFLYLQPLMGCVIAWFWLGEIPTWLTVVGGTLAVLGVVLATLPGLRVPAWKRRIEPETC
ncbi:MAG TPA: DMT family transporter [Gammaproteobacteria bacterium]|jgi:drug/metabolite transporter (DMT)-like permease|nr:DMT family transporter [Gammaproteobacteria bacterium]